MRVAIGVDTHKESLAAAAVDELGRPLEMKEFPNDLDGHRTLIEWVRSVGEDRRVGIEGSGSFGARAAQELLGAGEDVREVPAALAQRDRRRKPSQGKSDLVDALAIARVVAREDGLSSARRSHLLLELKLLGDYRDQQKQVRNQVANRTHRDLVVGFPGYQSRIPKLTAKKHLTAVLNLVSDEQSIRAELIRRRVAELSRLDREIAELTKLITAKVRESGTRLTRLRGVGAVTAAKILGEIGEPERIRSKSAFAMLNGTAPLAASSGATTRHRLNRGGNRQLNFAIHVIAVARRRTDLETKTYIQRRLSEGKTSKEAMRCLKRHLSNVVYRQLVEDAQRTEEAA